MALQPGNQVVELVGDELFPLWTKEHDRLDRIDRWHRWEQEDVPTPKRISKEMSRLRDLVRTPWLGLVVSTVAQCLYVDGYRSERELTPSEGNVSEPWRTWLSNGFDQRQIAVHRGALAYGYSFVTVLPGEDETGKRSVLRGVSPRKMQAVYDDPAEDDYPVYAVRVEPGGGKFRLRVIDDTYVHHLTLDSSNATPEYERSEIHDTGVTPVVRYANMLDLDGRCPGEVEPFIPLAERINKTVFDRLLTQHFSSWKVRTVSGMAQPDDEQEKNRQKLKLSQEDLLVAEDPDTKFSTLDGTPLDGFIASTRNDVETLAAITQTPTHALTGQLVNLPLALDTVVPVPGGRTTMGELAPGDQVLDPTGTPVDVVGVSPVHHHRDCYRLTFDDGTEIVADGDHVWRTTQFRSPNAAPYAHGRTTAEVTTREIARTVKTCMGTNNHYIPTAAPYDPPEQDFEIDPYVLGVWLGNGDHRHGVITEHVDDAHPVAEALRAAGERVDVVPCTDTPHINCASLKIRHDSDPFVTRLKRAGLHRNKHIPEAYFHGSYKQRLALVQGLMDTDGSVSHPQGSVAITLHHKRLAGDLHRLVQSLGHKVSLRERAWTSRQLGTSGTCWRMTWGAQDVVFRLPRKRDRQRCDWGEGDGKSAHPLRRYIVSCEPVASVPVRCISVASTSHLFCVTDAFIATHNSAEALAAARAGLTQKVAERQKAFGRSHVQVLQLAASQEGRPDEAHDLTARVTWQDMEVRSMSQAVDALGKAAEMLNIPVTALWQRIPGVEKSDVDEWKQLADQDDPITRMTDELSRQAALPTRETPEQ